MEATRALHPASDVDTLSKHSVGVPLQDCCPLRAGTHADIHKRHGTELLLSSGPACTQKEPELTPHPCLIQGVSSAVRNQASEGHPGSSAPSSCLIQHTLQRKYAPITGESPLLDGSQTCSPRSPKVDGQHAVCAFSNSSPCQHNAEQWTPYSPSTSTLGIIMFLPPRLAREGGRSQELAASHQKDASVHGGGTEQVSQVHGSRSFHLHPKAGKPMPPSTLPLETFTPVRFAQQSLSSLYSIVALSTQPRVPSEARGQQRIRHVTFCFSILESLLNCSVFNNPHLCLVPHFQT